VSYLSSISSAISVIFSGLVSIARSDCTRRNWGSVRLLEPPTVVHFFRRDLGTGLSAVYAVTFSSNSPIPSVTLYVLCIIISSSFRSIFPSPWRSNSENRNLSFSSSSPFVQIDSPVRNSSKSITLVFFLSNLSNSFSPQIPGSGKNWRKVCLSTVSP
jgi:hypothetical protein